MKERVIVLNKNADFETRDSTWVKILPTTYSGQKLAHLKLNVEI